MKKLFLSILAAAAMMIALPACDGLMGNEGENEEENAQNSDYGYYDVKVVETDDTIVFSYSFKAAEYSYEYKIEWKFRNDECVSCTYTWVAPSPEIAQVVYANFDEEEKAGATLKGNTITMDGTKEYEGESKEAISATANAMKSYIEMANKQTGA